MSTIRLQTWSPTEASSLSLNLPPNSRSRPAFPETPYPRRSMLVLMASLVFWREMDGFGIPATQNRFPLHRPLAWRKLCFAFLGCRVRLACSAMSQQLAHEMERKLGDGLQKAWDLEPFMVQWKST